MEKTKFKTRLKLKSVKAKLSIFAVLIAAMFLLGLSAGRVYASSYYFNDYYASLNGGLAETSPSGLSSKSGGTYNLSVGKNYNLNKFVIGGGAVLGYASNGSYTVNTVSVSVDSAYYGAFVKGGYAYKNIMPFVKLGYIGYSFNASTSYDSSVPLTSEGGLLYGAGVEYMFTPNWGVTAQYFGASLSGGDKVNSFTAGVDFNF